MMTQTYQGLYGPSHWSPKFYIDYIRILFQIEFSRTRNGVVIVCDMNYHFQKEIQPSTKKDISNTGRVTRS